jgi:hypothetical protein
LQSFALIPDIDYVDIHIPILMRMYKKRLKGYEAIGYTVQRWKNDLSRQPERYEYVSIEDLLDEVMLEEKR